MVVEVRDVERVYGQGVAAVHALRGVTLALDKGEFVALVGPSGCGKSTLLNLIGCLDGPDAGVIRLEGQDLSNLDDDALAGLRNRRIGFVFQSHLLLPRLSARANVELPMVYAGISRPRRRELALQGLARVGLTERAHHLPSQLSGGESQRVAFARALVLSPAILLADEPTGNLDSARAREIILVLEDLAHSGTTVLLVTHDAEMAARAGRMLHMRDGRVVQESARGSA